MRSHLLDNESNYIWYSLGHIFICLFNHLIMGRTLNVSYHNIALITYVYSMVGWPKDILNISRADMIPAQKRMVSNM